MVASSFRHFQRLEDIAAPFKNVVVTTDDGDIEYRRIVSQEIAVTFRSSRNKGNGEEMARIASGSSKNRRNSWLWVVRNEFSSQILEPRERLAVAGFLRKPVSTTLRKVLNFRLAVPTTNQELFQRQ